MIRSRGIAVAREMASTNSADVVGDKVDDVGGGDQDSAPSPVDPHRADEEVVEDLLQIVIQSQRAGGSQRRGYAGPAVADLQHACRSVFSGVIPAGKMAATTNRNNSPNPAWDENDSLLHSVSPWRIISIGSLRKPEGHPHIVGKKIINLQLGGIIPTVRDDPAT